MAGGTDSIEQYDNDALKATFSDARKTLNTLREELLSRGMWVDAKYNVTLIADLDDSHIVSIIRMLKNKSIKQSRHWKGLNDRSSHEFLLEHPAYEHLRAEAVARNLPGAVTLPEASDVSD